MFEALRKLLADWFGPPTQSQAHSPEPENAEISRSTMKTDEIHAEISEPIAVPPVPYDETLLERTRAQWRQGEWESLVRLDMHTIEHHPDRAKLGLAVASAWLQQGDSATARRYLHHAMNWGCDKKLAAQILTAGVHNTLGRAAAIAGDQVRMERHFRLAVAGSGNQIERASLGRRHVELQRLGLDLDHQSQLLETFKPSPLQAWRGMAEQTFCALGPAVVRTARSLKNWEELAAIKEEILTQPNTESDIPIDQIVENERIIFAKSKIPKEDMINAAYDHNPCNELKAVLIILSTPRSGSTYLCDLLKSNAICTPHEYFQPYEYMPILADRWGCINQTTRSIDPIKYVNSLIKHRTHSSGWLGINIHQKDLSVFQKYEKHFPNVLFKYIVLFRRDLIRQAISYEIASQTGSWSHHFPRTKKPKYNFEYIDSKIKEIEESNICLRDYLQKKQEHGITLIYEDLALNTEAELTRVFRHIDWHAPAILKTGIAKQSNSENDFWFQNFKIDLIKQVTGLGTP